MGKTILKGPDFSPLSKSTPSIIKGSHKVSWSPEGILQGGLGLMFNEVYPSFLYLIKFFDHESWSEFRQVWIEMVKTATALKASVRSVDELDNVVSKGKLGERPVPPIGKLGFKVEAAGKVRVFAMVECWTQ